jgi:hypothetical protein
MSDTKRQAREREQMLERLRAELEDLRGALKETGPPESGPVSAPVGLH